MLNKLKKLYTSLWVSASSVISNPLISKKEQEKPELKEKSTSCEASFHEICSYSFSVVLCKCNCHWDEV